MNTDFDNMKKDWDRSRNAARRAQQAKRQQVIRKRRRMQIAFRLCMLLIIGGTLVYAAKEAIRLFQGAEGASAKADSLPEKIVETPPDYQVELLTMNEYSRPGTAVGKITGVVVHYTANPGTTAMQNRNYFEGLKDSHLTKASSHFIIGMEGELVQCVPCNEVAYASNERNSDTISIECCIPDDTGKFTDATYDTLVHLVAWLCGRYGFTAEGIIRHYDITGKMCPKYYVEHEDKWEEFKQDVLDYIEKYGVIRSEEKTN